MCLQSCSVCVSRGDAGLKGAQESDLWLGRDLGHRYPCLRTQGENIPLEGPAYRPTPCCQGRNLSHLRVSCQENKCLGAGRRSWSVEAFRGACAPEPPPWVRPMAPAAGEGSVGPLPPHGGTWAAGARGLGGTSVEVGVQRVVCATRVSPSPADLLARWKGGGMLCWHFPELGSCPAGTVTGSTSSAPATSYSWVLPCCAWTYRHPCASCSSRQGLVPLHASPPCLSCFLP